LRKGGQCAEAERGRNGQWTDKRYMRKNGT
jgi:hypothetical protein